MKKLTVKQHAKIHTGLYILAAVLAIASWLREVKGAPRPLLWGALAAVVVSMIWRITFVKCPKCGDALSESRTIPDTCPNCGHNLKTNYTEGETPNE